MKITESYTSRQPSENHVDNLLIAIPLYSSAVGVIPVIEALMQKGASLGTTLAFMMAAIAACVSSRTQKGCQ
jgi:uncharacterized membrane protein YraQ (UPF0718 family)